MRKVEEFDKTQKIIDEYNGINERISLLDENLQAQGTNEIEEIDNKITENNDYVTSQVKDIRNKLKLSIKNYERQKEQSFEDNEFNINKEDLEKEIDNRIKEEQENADKEIRALRLNRDKENRELRKKKKEIEANKENTKQQQEEDKIAVKEKLEKKQKYMRTDANFKIITQEIEEMKKEIEQEKRDLAKLDLEREEFFAMTEEERKNSDDPYKWQKIYASQDELRSNIDKLERKMDEYAKFKQQLLDIYLTPDEFKEMRKLEEAKGISVEPVVESNVQENDVEPIITEEEPVVENETQQEIAEEITGKQQEEEELVVENEAEPEVKEPITENEPVVGEQSTLEEDINRLENETTENKKYEIVPQPKKEYGPKSIDEVLGRKPFEPTKQEVEELLGIDKKYEVAVIKPVEIVINPSRNFIMIDGQRFDYKDKISNHKNTIMEQFDRLIDGSSNMKNIDYALVWALNDFIPNGYEAVNNYLSIMKESNEDKKNEMREKLFSKVQIKYTFDSNEGLLKNLKEKRIARFAHNKMKIAELEGIREKSLFDRFKEKISSIFNKTKGVEAPEKVEQLVKGSGVIEGVKEENEMKKLRDREDIVVDNSDNHIEKTALGMSEQDENNMQQELDEIGRKADDQLKEMEEQLKLQVEKIREEQNQAKLKEEQAKLDSEKDEIRPGNYDGVEVNEDGTIEIKEENNSNRDRYIENFKRVKEYQRDNSKKQEQAKETGWEWKNGTVTLKDDQPGNGEQSNNEQGDEER